MSKKEEKTIWDDLEEQAQVGKTINWPRLNKTVKECLSRGRDLEAKLARAVEILREIKIPFLLNAESDCRCEPGAGVQDPDPEFICGHHRALHLVDDFLKELE